MDIPLKESTLLTNKMCELGWMQQDWKGACTALLQEVVTLEDRIQATESEIKRLTGIISTITAVQGEMLTKLESK